MDRRSAPWTGKINRVMVFIIPKFTYKFNVISIKSQKYFLDIELFFSSIFKILVS